DRHTRYVRRPARMKEQLRVIERTRRGVNHLTMDAAVFAVREGRLAEFYERVLSGEALPAFAQDPGRIDAARRERSPRAGRRTGRRADRARAGRVAAARTAQDRLAGAVRVVAIHRARN